MAMIVIGGIAIVTGVVFFFLFQSTKKQLYTLQAMPSRTAGELQTIKDEIAGELGAGNFSEVCKIQGVLKADNMVTSEISGEPCLYFSTTVRRQWEQLEEQTREVNGERRVEKRWVKHWETVSTNKGQADLYIDDGSGKVMVQLDGCKFDTVSGRKEFKPVGQGAASFAIGSFSISIPMGMSNHRTIGYEYSEQIIKPDTKALIAGRVTDEGGALTFKKPEDKQYKYFMSFKDEADLTKSLKTKINIFQYGSYGLGAVGLILLIVGFITK